MKAKEATIFPGWGPMNSLMIYSNLDYLPRILKRKPSKHPDCHEHRGEEESSLLDRILSILGTFNCLCLF